MAARRDRRLHARPPATPARACCSASGTRACKKRRRTLPSPKVFRREFLRFRKRYPFVTNYLTWNEANHCSQPTCRKPGRAARFYDILRKNCRRCTVSAPALLDKLDMPQWVRAFERKAKYRVKVWSLHNYIDANRFRTRGTRSLLRATKAKIWFTETGGLVRRDNGSRIEFADSPTHAVKATRWVIRLARLSKRVKRVYFYHWVAPPPRSTWDSALIDRRGRRGPPTTSCAPTCATAARRTASSPPRAGPSSRGDAGGRSRSRCSPPR